MASFEADLCLNKCQNYAELYMLHYKTTIIPLALAVYKLIANSMLRTLSAFCLCTTQAHGIIVKYSSDKMEPLTTTYKNLFSILSLQTGA